MANIDDLFSPPNGPAYEKQEVRVGPPREYVAQKFRYGVESAYDTIRAHMGVSTRIAIDTGDLALGEMERHDDVYRNAKSSLRYSVYAYVALQNMLGLMNAEDLIDRLLAGTRDDLEAWLDTVQNEGSPTG